MKKGSLKQLNWQSRFSYLKDVPFDEKDLDCEGAKFQIVNFKPGSIIKPHYHEKTTEIFFILKGRGLLKLNQTGFRCAPNDFFLCQPGDWHEFINDTEEDYIILIFKTNEHENDLLWH